MSSPTSCTRCSRPVAIVAPSGLCAECAATPETPATTSLAPPDPSQAPTATYGPGRDSFAPTASFEPQAPTVAAVPGADVARRPHHDPPAGYDLFHKLGGGGMGVVYLACEQASERRVAMKFLRFPGDTDAMDRFVIELRSLAKLDHPNIVRVLSNDFLRAEPFFTMEYAEGGSLSRSLGDAPLPPAEAVRVIRIVAGAVAAAHANDVIHRDLKPSNILLMRDGTLKVADFGLAKRLDQLDDATRASGAIGTPSYMPPEQISRKYGESGPWSDVYGLGATLYRLLSKRAPFVGDSPEEIIPQVIADAPPRLRGLNPAVPGGLEAIVFRCLEKDPKARYQSVAEFLADLDRYEQGQRTVARELTRWRRARQWVVGHRRGAALTAAVGVLLAATVAFTVALLRPPKPRDHVAEYQKELKAGRPVTLVPEKGLPAWHRWVYGATELAEAPARGKACSFETIESSMLEVLPDPGVDAYEARADLCLLRLRVPGGQNAVPDPTNLTGLYFANVSPDGISQVFLAATYNDFLDPVLRKAGQTRAIAQVRSVCLSPTFPPGPSPTAGAGRVIRFPPAADLPAEWRRVRVVVTPDRVRVFWATDPGSTPDEKMELIGDYSVEDMNRLLQNHRAALNAAQPGLGDAVPAWSPRLPIGIWCRGGAVAVKNLIVTPLPRK